MYVREPTAEQAALARKLQLPITFFCYKNEPGYISDDQTDGETQDMERGFVKVDISGCTYDSLK